MLKITPQASFAITDRGLQIIRLSSSILRRRPRERQSVWAGWSVEKAAKELLLGWTGNKGALECAHRTYAEVLSKESGLIMPPSQWLVQSPAGRRLFYPGAPPILAEKWGLLAQGRTSWWSALLGASLTEKAGSTCRGMWGKEWCWNTVSFC